MKKRLFLISILLLSIISVSAQEWSTDLSEAKNIALNENKTIILVFQGSDWCVPCIKLDREIWSSDEFKNYAQDHFVMLKADFPRKKKNKLDDAQQENNNKLAEQYNKNGFFPLVVVLDKDGNVLGTTGYKKISPTDYIKLLVSFSPTYAGK